MSIKDKLTKMKNKINAYMEEQEQRALIRREQQIKREHERLARMKKERELAELKAKVHQERTEIKKIKSKNDPFKDLFSTKKLSTGFGTSNPNEPAFKGYTIGLDNTNNGGQDGN